MEEQEAKAILDCAKSNGIEFLDTAITYGKSESVLGRIGVEAWQVVSKLPKVPDTCVDIEKWIKSQVCLSIERLGIPKATCPFVASSRSTPRTVWNDTL